MKDSNDNLTADLLPVPRPRGRPRTGTAMTNAERQAKHRAKRALQADKTVTVTVNDEFATVTVKRDELSLLLTIVQVASEASGFFGFSVDDRRALSGLEAAIGRAVYADTPLEVSQGALAPTSRKVVLKRASGGRRRNARK
ncbi:hypothetical protein JHD42_23170 [Aeromonas veronii]|jgi:hypothetical protein|uniref:Uncharacterized protein n=1 Tax=uncultured prokaryote TaxID=198431 RepID=A0A0H5Q1D6_9ZZZZ|nr:hypothetical protein [Aeromonas veronii]MBJ7583920.1 hypothetical protein [Aeromonas veronii]CRY95663.1 hypothetical protein [uncultured prokaryote]